MLLLMRRVGEAIRINEKITLQVKEIHQSAVTFIIGGLGDELSEVDKKRDQEIDNE